MKVIAFMVLLINGFLFAETAHHQDSVYGVPVLLFLNLVAYESGFHSDRININKDGTTDNGIMQLNSAYIQYYADEFNGGVTFDPMNQIDNIRIGCTYLVYLKGLTGSWFGAVWAYNAGPGRWKRGVMPEVTKKMLAVIFDDLLEEKRWMR